MKFTLLVILLVVILSVSYYMNEEGFQTLAATTGSVSRGTVPMGTSVPVASAPLASAPLASAPVPSAPMPSASTATKGGMEAAPVLPGAAPPTSVQVSDLAYDAMSKNQRSALLSDIQKVIRNEILSNRAIQSPTDMAAGNKTGDSYDDEEEEDEEDDSDFTAQGRDYRKSSYKNEDACSSNRQCDPLTDMTKYIRKDQIPCWGCNIDY